MHLKGTVKIVKEDDWFVAICLENDVASQGETVEEAIENLKEAITLRYEDGDCREELQFLQNHEFFFTTFEMTI